MYHFKTGYDNNVNNNAKAKISDNVGLLNTSKYNKNPSAFISYKHANADIKTEKGANKKLP